ncbi:hypothetical protein [Streptomyces californicus]|uniref:hypothetical protein n=1 Tax=Streptomyces californicus TaxID=67351 RepID=UPI00379CA42E
MEAEVPDETDAAHLRAAGRPEGVAAAGRLAQAMVDQGLPELLALHEARAGDTSP